jgi:hypothetical protein
LLVPVCFVSKTTLMWRRDCAWAPALQYTNIAAMIAVETSRDDFWRIIEWV